MKTGKAFLIGAGISQIPIIGPIYLFLCYSATVIIFILMLILLVAPSACGTIAQTIGVSSEEEIPFEPFTIKITVESLNVRTFPGTNFPIVGQLYQGDEITVWGIPSKAGWYEITFENRSRFICSDFVESINENI